MTKKPTLLHIRRLYPIAPLILQPALDDGGEQAASRKPRLPPALGRLTPGVKIPIPFAQGDGHTQVLSGRF